MLTLRPLPLLWGVTIAVIVLHVVGIAIERIFGVSRMTGPLRQIDLNAEANLTAWFSSFLLLACAAVAFVLTVSMRRLESDLARRWSVLAGLLLAMSVDEAAQLHDLATGPLRRALDTDLGLFHFAWVIPALAIVAAVAIHLAPLVRTLEVGERRRLLAAVGVYLTGAVVLEMLGGLVVNVDWDVEGYPLSYLVITTLEESGELVGALLLLGALLHVAARRGPHLLLGIAADPTGAKVEIEPSPTA